MNIKNTKQAIMGLSAMLILLFHLFPINIGTGIYNGIINYIIMICYIGVDIFFFLSGYMLIFSNTDKYIDFIKNKIIRVYPLFIASVFIFLIMENITLNKAFKILINVDVFSSGGASFLWFLQAIFIFYFIAPVYKKHMEVYSPLILFFIFILIWVCLMLLLEKIIDNHSSNIFLCRMPIFIIGMTLAKFENKLKEKNLIIIFLALTFVGIYIIYKFGYRNKINYPITNIFYIYSIPITLGIIGLFDIIFSNKPPRFFNFLGKITLELYVLQMMFGRIFFNFFIDIFTNAYLVFFIEVGVLIIFSFILNKAINCLNKRIYVS